jgi:hypothetical protein
MAVTLICTNRRTSIQFDGLRHFVNPKYSNDRTVYLRDTAGNDQLD